MTPNQLTKFTLPALAIAAIVLLGWGWTHGLNAAPDFRQGYAVRIMFVHVPAAWTCLGAWTVMSVASLIYILSGGTKPLADMIARNAAPPGAAFTFICLATGSLWGKPIWNTWWEWDARMTSVLALFLMFLGYMAIRTISFNQRKIAKISAIYCLAGSINLPVIKFSVEWWNTLHQPTSLWRSEGPAMPPEYLTPLLVSALGCAVLFVAVTMCLVCAEMISRQTETMIQQRSDQK